VGHLHARWLLLTGSIALLWATLAQALPDAGLMAELGKFEARRDAMLASQVASPYPPDGAWHDTDFALAALFRNEKLPEANAILCGLKAKLTPQDQHWQMNHLQRIWFLFNARSSFFPGRLTQEAEAALLRIFWDYAHADCRLSLADPEHTWYIWGSENHGAMKWSGFWGTAHILAQAPDYRDRRYDDGTSPAQMAAAWDEFFKRYARERAGKGLLVEISSGYNKYTIQGWYDMADFATDPELRRRMTCLLDLFWADWAVQQIDGALGGSKARMYHGAGTTRGLYALDCSWLYFGLGPAKSRHPSIMCPATSFYRPPLVVMDMALDTAGRGTYEYLSRRPGLNLIPRPEGLAADTYALDPDFGGLAKYTYATPDFIMGATMLPARPCEDWSAISSQNRWDGVVFAGAPDSRLAIRGMSSPTHKTYNLNWSVQHKGVFISQKLKTAKRGPAGFRVWFSADLKPVERDGWVFCEAPRAYAAVKVLRGAWDWQPAADYDEAPGQWLCCADEYSPVLIEVARPDDADSFAAFQDGILGNPLALDGDTVRYHSARYATNLSFFADYSRVPEINGQPVDFRPPEVFNCPFIRSQWDSGVVELSKDDRHLTLDFNQG
jgi:hypothetical protein